MVDYQLIHGLNLENSIKKLSNFSDAYIEAVLYGKFRNKHNIADIREAIEKFRNENKK